MSAGGGTDMADNAPEPEQVDAERRPPGLVEHAPAPEEGNRAEPRRHRWRWLLLGQHHEPPVTVTSLVDDPPPERPRVGICCSGGGVRSASFNLGALQALQKQDRLRKAEYLAAVSGGSYIAAAFAMVAKTKRTERDGEDSGESDPDLVTPAAPPFHPGSPEEQYLRNRASYLAPTGTAKALLAWRVLLGLLVNLVLISAIIVVVAALITLHYRAADPGLIRPPAPGVAPGATPNGWIWGVGVGLCGIAIVLGGISILTRPLRRDGVRRFLEVFAPALFAIGLVVFALELLVPSIIDALRTDHPSDTVAHARTVGAGVTASVVGIVAAIIAQLRAGIADPAKAIEEADGALKKLAPRFRLTAIYVATAVLGPLLLFAIFIAATMVQVESTRRAVQIGVPAGAVLVLVYFCRFADLNSWSLHPFYRRRLTSAFALRRTHTDGDPPSGHAEPRKDDRNLLLSGTTVLPESPKWDPAEWPHLIVCAAANVSDPGVAPPGRGVTSFTFSPDELGGPLVGGLRTTDYETGLSSRRQPELKLPAAVAISGAALSPSMDKLPRPSIRFLLAMANVRLGVWLPNPRRIEAFVRIRSSLADRETARTRKALARLRGASAFDAEHRKAALKHAIEEHAGKTHAMPRPTVWYLVKELLGWNSINDKFLYVTDGGHYENLGLVELLRRGCTRIYCFDASNGEPLGALGDAIALARSELGVEITFPREELQALQADNHTKLSLSRCATGTFRYTRLESEVEGTLVYAPTVITEDLPWDVLAFRKVDQKFPHTSTANQLFTDQRFEAYRMLGYEAGRRAVEAMDRGPVLAAPVAEAPTNGHRDEVSARDLRERLDRLVRRVWEGRPAA